MNQHKEFRDFLEKRLEELRKEPQRVVNHVIGYVEEVGAYMGFGKPPLMLKTPIYGICKDEMEVPHCEMVLIDGVGGFTWVRHNRRNIFLNMEAKREARRTLVALWDVREPGIASNLDVNAL